MIFQETSNEILEWTQTPRNVLLIKRIGELTRDAFIEILNFLIHTCSLHVFVEQTEYESDYLKTEKSLYNSNTNIFDYNLKIFEEKNKNSIDMIICLGGDGTLLHVSSLFQSKCPPILSINFGSLGFLCPFEFADYESHILSALRGGVPLINRSRLNCKLINLNDSSDSFTIDCKSFQEQVLLNEIVIHGSNSYLSSLDLYVNDQYVTTIQGDGLVISTPTGSTAYSMSTGASLCHPCMDSIIISTICPHSLSYRPIILPLNVEIKICPSQDSRGSSFFLVDGKNMTELKQENFLLITNCDFKFPTLTNSDKICDWFESLSKCLNWNQRPKQQPLDKSTYKPPRLAKTSSTNDLKSFYLCVPSADCGYCSSKSDEYDEQ